MNTLSTYKREISELSDFLQTVGQERWSVRLSQWVSETESSVDPIVIRQHIERTKKALVGMGSVGDFVVTNSGDHQYSTEEIKALNAQKDLLVEKLYKTTKLLTSDLSIDQSSLAL
jgi:hypothetical protein